MLKTIYSNAYEILEAYLSTEITEDKRCSHNPFERVRVISSTGAINNRLRQHLAKINGVCSGIDFWTTESWFHNYAGIGVGEPEENQDFLWVIWSVLTDDFITHFDRLRTYFSNQQTSKDKALARYELARKIASVFDKYVNYRFDWVAHWMGFDRFNPATVYRDVDSEKILKEKEALESHPDFAWQKAIWEELSRTHVWAGRETLKLYARPESLDIKIANEPQNLHFFIPFSISPLMLPIIKLLSESEHNVYVYLLNPCNEYWFESFTDSEKDEKALHYLRKNAASTRALINRFWTFTPDSQDNAGHQPQKLPDLTRAPLQRLNIWTQAETERLDLIQTDGSLLHRAQKAIVENSSDELPELINRHDRSIRFIKAPTLTREVQNSINMIQDFFADKSLQLKPEDVLIVTPEIDKTAPVFEACMQALPPEFRIDYQIIGRGAIDSDMSSRSLLDLGKLLMNGVTLTQLNAWLELPLVGQSLGLTLNDLNIVHDWLLCAGFRNGINLSHYKYTHPNASQVSIDEAADGTLDRAIERLSWGYVFCDENAACPGDILPIQHGYDRFADIGENKDLFLKLCLLTQKLSNSYESMVALGQQALPGDLSLWAHGLIDNFFENRINHLALLSLRTNLRVQEWALTTVPEPVLMPLSVYWKALEDKMTQPSDRNPAVGRITLAPMQTFRGLPFKVIIAIGMGEESGFPGNQRFEEFDLMGDDALKRQNDRDSRSDNRNIFLDLFLAARDRFVCSYCVGNDKKAPLNPSPVVVDLIELLTLNARPSAKENALETKTRIIQNLTAEITLTDTASENFRSTPTRYWKSFMGHTLTALNTALEVGYQNNEPIMLKGPLGASVLPHVLYLEDLTVFYFDPCQWIQKLIDFKVYETQIAESVPLIGSTGALEMSALRHQILKSLSNGDNIAEVEKRIELDPTKGTAAIRLLTYQTEIDVAMQIHNIVEKLQRMASKTIQNFEMNLDNTSPFEKLVIENVELYRFDKICQSEEWPWLNELDDKIDYLISVCSSNSSLLRSHIKAATLACMGHPVGTIALSLNSDNIVTIYEPVENDFARLFTQSFIKLMSLQVQKACVIASQSQFNIMEPVFWRGRDYDTIKNLSEEFISSAQVLITPKQIFPAKKYKKKTALQEQFETKFTNLLAGGQS